MDVTARGFDVSESVVKTVFEDICRMNSDDDFEFRVVRLSQIREGADYPGIRVALSAIYGKVRTPFTVDVTTGDAITPKEIVYKFPLVFDEGYIRILSYNLETILAEKLQTILSRGVANTRMRDFYDIYVLGTIYINEIDFDILKRAVLNTSMQRNKPDALANAKSVIEIVKSDSAMNKLWESYRFEFNYANPIEFEMTCRVIAFLVEKIADN